MVCLYFCLFWVLPVSLIPLKLFYCSSLFWLFFTGNLKCSENIYTSSLSLSLPPFKYLLTLSLFSSIIHILSLSHPSCRKCESIREREFQILVTQSLVSLFLASAKAINPLYNETKQTFCRRINFSNLFNVYFKTAIFVIQY